MLCEIAGAVQRQGGLARFFDPEARLNKEFAKLFDLDTSKMVYEIPDTIPKVFSPIRKWTPEPSQVVHGIFADSLAALSTEMELADKDQYGMRRAKEFSEELRKTCRTLTEKNFLMVCSNQVRENIDAGMYEQRYRSPGGMSIGFYSSLRLRCWVRQKIKKKETIASKEITRVVGVETEVEVYKSSVWKPYRTSPLTILFDYGIDDVRENLQFVKDHTDSTLYMLGETKLSRSLEKACSVVESEQLESELRNQVINLWEEIEKKFDSERKPKRRE